MSTPDDATMPFVTESALVGSATLAAIQPVAFPADTLLFRAGDVGDRLYIIVSGQVALIQALDAPDERVLDMRGPGELIGEMSYLIPNKPSRASARVHADAVLLVLQRTEVDGLLRREPLLAYEMLRFTSSQLHRSHHRAMREMEAKNAQLAQAYTALQAAQTQLLEQERLRHELRLAREIQERMLPTELPQRAGIALGARIIPAHEVGGDFYDVFALDNDTLGVVIGDVCGKGMPAALYMAQTRSLIRAEARLSTSPAEVLLRVNQHLRELNTGTMFVTTVFGRLDCPTQTFAMARAGHEYPLAWRADGMDLSAPRGIGQPLGLFADPALDVQTHALMPGDTLLLYTDGVTDATNPAGAFFAQERLRAVIRAAPTTTAQGLCDQIVETVVAFEATAPQADDMTLLAVRAE